MKLYELTIHELHEKLKNKEVSSVEATREVFSRIDAVEDKVRSFVTITRDEAMRQAEEADKRIASGDIRPLTGIPIAVKDIFCTKGIRTTCSSKILENFIPPYDSTVVAKLKKEGAVILGKTNMDEFAMGSSTETSFFGVTRNPWDLDRVPGGSSGGSAASLAASECIASIGTDTGGSIRQPAALCGVVGLKPTYGRVSRYGMIAFASSLDQGGPMTKDVRDAATMLQAMAGHDRMDSTSVDIAVPDYSKALASDIKGLKIGLPKEYFIEGMNKEVDESVRKAVKDMEGLGAEVVEITLPHTEYAVAVYYLVATAEASSNLARFDGAKYGYRAENAKDLLDMYKRTRAEGFGSEVKRRIMLGTYALSSGYYDAYYLKAQKARTLIKKDFDDAFKKCDVIVTPTAPTPAFKIGEKTADPLQMYLSDIFTISVNLAGLPAISLPCGFTGSNLPIGLQIIGKGFDEETVLRAAHAYEQATEWHKKKPNL
ncbi:MAG TPA: Asp-tRNA(Asn)/Glu-tRNA(Gln) amidotransferase subunit GatA [Thermodesulfobacteriota bacterium]|nr:Asp-tRNA(Asn)/Glu-tRNA(Gln) amidotransferase subunit GatA [Thermodesulfobacteriota bacterium]